MQRYDDFLFLKAYSKKKLLRILMTYDIFSRGNGLGFKMISKKSQHKVNVKIRSHFWFNVRKFFIPTVNMFPSNIHSLFKKGYIQVIFDKSDNVGYSITPLGEEKIKRNYEWWTIFIPVSISIALFLERIISLIK